MPQRRCSWPPGKLWKWSLESNPVTLQATLCQASQSLCLPVSVYTWSLHLKFVCHSLLTCLNIGALNPCVIFQIFLHNGIAGENFNLLLSFPLFFNCSRTFGAWHAINSIQMQPKSLTGQIQKTWGCEASPGEPVFLPHPSSRGHLAPRPEAPCPTSKAGRGGCSPSHAVFFRLPRPPLRILLDPSKWARKLALFSAG